MPPPAPPLLIDDFSLPLNRLECDLSDEFAARQRELDWIATVGDDLAKKVDPEEECDARAMASEVEERWQKVVFLTSLMFDHFIRSFLKILFGSIPLNYTPSSNTFTKLSCLQVKSLWEERTARISEARMNSKAIGEELKELREWMRDPEGRLGRPVSVHDTSEKEYKKKRKEYQVG